MPDFKIMLTTDLKDGGAEKKLSDLKSKYEKDGIKLKTDLDIKDFNSQMNELKKTMQNAFKLDNGQLSNLQKLKTTLQEISKLSKESQKSIFGGNNTGIKNETTGIQKLSQSYDKLLAKQKSIEQQMSKTTNKQSYAVLATELDKVRSNADSVAKSLDKIGATKGNSSLTKSLASTFQSVQKEIQATITQMDNLFKNKNLGSDQSTQLAKYRQELVALQNIKLDSILNADKQYAEMSKLVTGASEIKQAFSGLKINITFNNQIDKAKNSIDGLVSKLQTLGKSGFSDTTGIANTLSQLTKLKSELNNINPNSSNATAQLKNISNAINQCETEYKQLNSAMQSSKANFTFNTNVTKTVSDLQRLRQECVSLGQSTKQVDALEKELKELGNVSTDKATAGLKKIKSDMSTLKSDMSKVQTSTSGVQRTFGNLYATIGAFSIGNILGNQIQKGVYAIGSTITELDTAFTGLMKVAPDSFRGTSKELDNLRNKAIEVGQSVAKSSVDIINSTASALQLGIKDMDKALEYAKNVNLFANVSDQSEEDADIQLKGVLSAYGGIDKALKSNQSSLKGANAQYNEMTNLMDQLNYAGNNYAVTSGDISEALSRFASVSSASGIEMYQAVSYAMGTNETLQNSEKTGNALKTIITNLNGLKTSSKDGSISLNKTAKVLKNIAGIDVLDSTGQVKDMNEILGELGEKYKTLSKNDRLALGEGIGGKTQINAVQALLGNWDQVVKYQQEYNQGLMVGSSDAENERFVDSIQGRVVKLQEELKKLVTTTISTDMFKGMVTGLTNVFSSINSVIGAFDKMGMSTPLVLGSITSMLMTIKSLGTGTQIPQLSNMFKGASNSVLDVKKNVLSTNKSFTTLANGTTKYSSALRVSEKSTGKLTQNLKTSGVAATNVAGKYQLAANGTKSLSTSMVAAGAKTALTSVGMTLLNGALLTVAMVGISMVIKGISNYIHASEIAHDKIVDSMETTKSKINSLKTEKSTLTGLASEYDNLTKKTKLNNDESERLAELKQQIAEISPDLVIGYDSNNNPILALNGSLEDYISGLDEAIKRQNELLKTQQNAAADKSIGTGKKYTSGQLDATFNGIGNVGHAYDDFTNIFNKDGLKSFRDGANEYVKILEKRNDQVSSLNIKNAENYEKYSAIELEQQTKAINKLSEGTLYQNFNKLNEKTKNSMSTLIGNFDWESNVANTLQGQNKFIKGFDTLSSKIGENSEKVQEWNKKLIAANDSYQKTGDIESYKQSISGVTSELEKLTGIGKQEWETGFTQQLVGGLDEAQISLNQFLKGYHKTIEDLNNQDPIAIKLKAEFESTQNLLSDLTAEGQTFESAVDLLVKVNKGEVDYGNLPYQLQTFLAGALDGGSKMTTDELQAFMEISTIISSQGELEGDTYGLITKMLNGELTKEEIELGIKLPNGATLNKNIVESINQANKSKGDKNVKVGVESDLSKFKSDLQAIFGDDKDKKLKIETEVEKKDLDGLSKSLKELDTETQIDILTSVLENGQLTIPELEEVLNTLPPEVQSVIRTVLEETGLTEANTKLQNLPEYVSIVINTEMSNDGKVELDKMAEWLNSTDLSKRIQLDVVSNLANNDLDGLLKTIEDLDPKVQLEILSNSQNVLSTFGEIDNYKFTEKLIQLSLSSGDIESALAMFKQLDDNDKKIQIVAELFESGSLRIDELTRFIELLPNEKQVDIITSLQKKGDLSPEEIQLLISGLPAEVQKKINVTTSGASTSKKELNEVDKGSKDQNKKVNVSEQGGSKVISTEKQVDDKSQNKDKKVKIAQTGGQPTLTLLDSINNKKLQDKKFTIKTVYETIKNTVTNFISGNKGGHSTQSLSEVAPLSDTSQDSASPMTREMPQPTTSNQVPSRAVGSFGDVLTNPTQSTNISTSLKNVLNMIKYGVNLFQELENRISRTGNQLDLLKVQMEDAVGTKKIAYLKTQNKLYEEQAKLQKVLFDSLNNEKSSIKSSLQSQGFSFNWQGNFDNYEEQLLRLEEIYKSTKTKESDYTGDNETTKKNLAKATENANDKLEDAKKLTEKYLQLHYTDIPKAEQSWYDLQNSIKATNDEIEKLDFENKIYTQVNAIDKLNNAIEIYQSYADKSNSIANRLSGVNKVKYIKEEVNYIKKQIELTKELMTQQQLQQSKYIAKMRQYGVEVSNSTGEVINYNDVLNNYQNNDDLDKVKQYMDDYVDLVSSQMKASNSMEDLISSMQDLQNESSKLELENKLQPFNLGVEELNNKIKRMQNNLSVIDIKMNNAYGNDKLKLLREQISLYKSLEELQKSSIDSMKQQEAILQRELSMNGFHFSNGEIINMQSALNQVENSGAYDYISDVLEQWKDLHNNEIPDAIDSIEDFKKSIKDAYKEQLDITQDIEDKIKDIYEKQLEDRKNAIEKETDAVKKSLEEQKKAYQDMRKEVDYQNDYAEKTDNISQLEKKLETARKDTSISNKKKIADLEKELSDARKDLEEFVQDKIDSDVEDSYDKAMDVIEESNDKKIEELEKTWSDSKIAEMISQSLKTGLFEGIDGTITNLQDAMLNFANESGDLFGVMGSIVEEELVGNLGIAVDSLRNYAEIMSELGLDKVNASLSTGMISNRSVTTGDISINISTAANVNEQDIANKVEDAINKALQGAVQGL